MTNSKQRSSGSVHSDTQRKRDLCPSHGMASTYGTNSKQTRAIFICSNKKETRFKMKMEKREIRSRKEKLFAISLSLSLSVSASVCICAFILVFFAALNVRSLPSLDILRFICSSLCVHSTSAAVQQMCHFNYAAKNKQSGKMVRPMHDGTRCVYCMCVQSVYC